MIDKLAAAAGVLLMAAFVLFVAFDVGAVPLILISVVAVGMAALDAWQAVFRT
jgi:hypothetical protein